MKRSASAHRTFSPDSPAMAMDNPLHCRQADPGSRKIFRRMHSLKGAEEFSGISHVKTGTVVAYEKCVIAFLAAVSKLDTGRRPFGGEFPGVGKQVGQHHAEQSRVPLGGEPLGDYAIDLPLCVAGMEFIDDLAHHFRQVNQLPIHRYTIQLRQIQQIID
jgi:hypothetical protein